MRYCLLLVFLALTSVILSQGYPEDTIWFDEKGELKETFVVSGISFEFDDEDLIDYVHSVTYLKGDSLYVHNMYQKLDSLAIEIIKDSSSFIIEGHTDCRGSDNYSYRLSEARAKTIYNYLIDRGVSKESLSFVGREGNLPRRLKGELLTCSFIQSQKNKDTQEQMHQLNRRISLIRIIR